MNEPLTIFGIAGSLRQASYNRSLLKSTAELVPDGARLDIFDDLAQIPPFDQDYEDQPPQVVIDMKSRIRAADAVIFVTPEYNYSVSGVLKNAIDWASRPYGDSAWFAKPAAIMSVSASMFGGARAQYHLRQMLVFLDMYAINRPEVMVANASYKFDEDGRLNDVTTREMIRQQMVNLVDLVRKLSPVEAAAAL